MPNLLKKLKSSIANSKSTSGFTLIELLVVIVIISILASLLMFNFVGVRQRARDGARKTDLRQIQTALELYRSDNSAYPLTAGLPSCGNIFQTNVGGTGVTYMQKVPCDPLGSTAPYNTGNYYYISDGIQYTLVACLENNNDNDTNSTITNPYPAVSGCPANSKYYVLQNP